MVENLLDDLAANQTSHQSMPVQHRPTYKNLYEELQTWEQKNALQGILYKFSPAFFKSW